MSMSIKAINNNKYGNPEEAQSFVSPWIQNKRQQINKWPQTLLQNLDLHFLDAPYFEWYNSTKVRLLVFSFQFLYLDNLQHLDLFLLIESY